MSAHVTTVTSRTYRLPMPRPWGPEVTCQYLITLQAQTPPGHGLVFAADALEQVTPG